MLLAAVGLVARVEAAAPTFVMFYGNILPKPIVVAAGNEKLFDRQGLVSVDGKVVDLSRTNDFLLDDLKDRPYLDLALFWGSEWVHYREEGKPLDQLKPEDAERTLPPPNSRGRFYPACGDRQAGIYLYSGVNEGYTIKRLSDDALKLLDGHGVPIRAVCPENRVAWIQSEHQVVVWFEVRVQAALLL